MQTFFAVVVEAAGMVVVRLVMALKLQQVVEVGTCHQVVPRRLELMLEQAILMLSQSQDLHHQDHHQDHHRCLQGVPRCSRSIAT
jgi:hypothetical protein